jgi:hypothetical protein
MSDSEQVRLLQEELDRKDRIILDMRLALIEARLAGIEKDEADHEARLRVIETRTTEVRTIVTLAFGTGLLSLGNILTIYLR